MTELEAIQLLIKMKELGITKEEVADIMAKNKQPEPSVPTEAQINSAFNTDEFSDEEVMFWHTPYYDELQAKKKAQEAKLNGEEEN